MKIAIVEDDKSESQLIIAHLKKFQQENGINMEGVAFADGLDFLENYSKDYDAVFMDIEMPHLNGMDTAERLRKIDDNVPLVFITNMKQFAINGYSVGAKDFLLKPVNYTRLETVLKKLIRQKELDGGPEKVVRTDGGMRIVKLSQIYFVEVQGHRLLYHTDSGDFETYGTLKELEREFGEGFVKCNNCYLVNLKYVTGISGDEISVGQYKVTISYRKRKDFITKLLEYGGRV